MFALVLIHNISTYMCLQIFYSHCLAHGSYVAIIKMKDWTCAQTTIIHGDVIKWKHFPRYWPFVRGIQRWLVNSPHKGQWRGALMFSLICTLNKRLNKQSWCWWFETSLRSLWRHCNDHRQSIYSWVKSYDNIFSCDFDFNFPTMSWFCSCHDSSHSVAWVVNNLLLNSKTCVGKIWLMSS